MHVGPCSAVAVDTLRCRMALASALVTRRHGVLALVRASCAVAPEAGCRPVLPVSWLGSAWRSTPRARATWALDVMWGVSLWTTAGGASSEKPGRWRLAGSFWTGVATAATATGAAAADADAPPAGAAAAPSVGLSPHPAASAQASTAASAPPAHRARLVLSILLRIANPPRVWS